MANPFFQFKQFIIQQDRCAMKVTTDGCLFGAWAGEKVRSKKSKVRNILDIGSGTGLLALMIAQKVNANIDAIEIDKDAFEQAKENIAASPWAERINIFHADAKEFIFPGKYDVIISNPPFYEKELKSDNIKKNIAHHGGLSLNELLSVIKKKLFADGKFYLLLPYKRNTEIERLVPLNDLSITQKTLVRQSVKHDSFRIMIEGRHKQVEEKIIMDEISICNDQQQYTIEFIKLLKAYYLYL
jgi:tRNA1Val (adenine37-N6)-methyltransferase